MRWFLIILIDPDTDNCMRFSFEFNGYFDTLCGLRKNIDDVIDMQVGLILDAHVGSNVENGDCWATIYHRGILSEEHLDRIKNSLTISEKIVESKSRIIDII